MQNKNVSGYSGDILPLLHVWAFFIACIAPFLAGAEQEGLSGEVMPGIALNMQEATYDRGYSQAEGFKGIRAQDQLDYRYFNEDVGFGLVFMAELGRQIGVDTPVMDAVITLASTVMQRDYRGEQTRTMTSLGLGEYSLEELKSLL